MKDYLLSFSVLGLVLGFYSAIVLTQSHPAHAVAQGTRSTGSSSSAVTAPVTTAEITENATETTSPSIESKQQLTR